MLYRAEISSTMDYKEDHTHAISYWDYNQSMILLDDSILSTISANSLGVQDTISESSV
jgi:hypothetical protein